MNASKVPRSTANFVGIATISAAALSYEIVLSRLFSVQQFYHFAFVVVSLAVMGFAASGTLLALRPKPPPLGFLSSLFSSSILVVYVVLNWLPFDSFSIAWDRSQFWILIIYFFAASLPFVLSGWIVGAALTLGGPSLHLPYAANLMGSGLGCGIALLGMEILEGEGAVFLSLTLGFAATFLFTKEKWAHLILIPVLGLGLWMSWSTPLSLSLRLSPYKPLSITSLIPDADLQYSKWSAATRVDIIESQGIHVFPGLSLNMTEPLPNQLALFVDGDGPHPITNLSAASPSAQRIAEAMPGTLAYRLRPQGDVLLLRGGAGLEAIFALASDAKSVQLVIPDPLYQSALQQEEILAIQDVLLDPRISILQRSDRGALQGGYQSYDVIVFALSEPFRPVTSGAFSLTEYYLLTVEAIEAALERLTQNGLLVITQWLGTPPSESAKAWAALLEAWGSTGENPDNHMIAYRSMRTATLIASRAPYTRDELVFIRESLDQNGFDPVYLPDIKPSELNRYNQLPSPVYHNLFLRLRDDLSKTIDDYEFRIEPPTDDRPFFFHFFRWAQTPAILSQLGQQWLPFGGSGYLVLLALLFLMILAGVILIISPLAVHKVESPMSMLFSKQMVFFSSIGAGYLLVEVSFLQRFTLLFDRPAFALAAVLFSMLLTSGLGSLLVPRLALKPVLRVLVLYLIGLSLALYPMIEQALHWGLLPQVLLTIAVLSPAGLLMGVPFAHGLATLQQVRKNAVPWAWAVNGATSGMSGVLAVMISLDLGIRATLLAGTIAYIFAHFASLKHK